MQAAKGPQFTQTNKNDEIEERTENLVALLGAKVYQRLVRVREPPAGREPRLRERITTSLAPEDLISWHEW